MSKKKDSLTPKQERFCRFLFEGNSQREAYIKAGYSDKAKPNVIDRNAYELANRNYIITRLDELKKKAEDESVMSVIERKQILSKQARGELKDVEVIQHPDGTKTTKVRMFNPTPAISEVNKMERIGGHGDEGSIMVLIQKIVNNMQVNNISVEQLSDEELRLLSHGDG